MSAQTKTDWNPGAYARFRDLRLRPALDLLNSVDQIGSGDVIDLGCGNGAMGEILAARFASHSVVGVDASPAMLDKARQSKGYGSFVQGDIADWHPLKAPGLIFSNAAIHWVGDHTTLLPRLVGMLGRGGTLAVQVPHQNNAPSHRVWLSLADELFPDRIDREGLPGVMNPVKYEELLSPLGRFRLWETDYYQRLGSEAEGHPVRRFTESTYARPVLDALTPNERQTLIAAYENVMQTAYPIRDNGTVLFPFRRMFFTLTV